MFGSRSGRPSLIGRAAGTAARTAVAGSSAQKQMAKAQAAELAHAERLAAVGAAPAETAAPAPDTGLDALRKLAAAHDGGILNDAEFIAKVKERLA